MEWALQLLCSFWLHGTVTAGLQAVRQEPTVPLRCAAPTMLALAAGLWHGLEDQGQQQQQRGPSAQHVQSASDLVSFGSGWGEAGTGNDGSTPQQRVTQQPGGSGGCCVLLMGAASDGRVWQWQAPLLEGTLPEFKPAALPPPPKPELLGGPVGKSNEATSSAGRSGPQAIQCCFRGVICNVR